MKKNKEVKLLDLFVDAYIKNNEKKIAIINDIDFNSGEIKVYFFNDEEDETLSIKDIKEIMSTNADLVIGDHVKIEPVFFNKKYEVENPINIVGEVFEDDGYWLYVNWSNGTQNTYRKLDADLLKV